MLALKSLALILAIQSALLSQPAAAVCVDATMCDKAELCSDLLVAGSGAPYDHAITIPTYRPTKSFDVEHFLSSETNRYHLFLETHRLQEVKNVPVRHQCFGTCYAMSSLSSLQAYLQRFKAIPEESHVIEFIPLMRVLNKRWSEKAHSNRRMDFHAGRFLSGGYVSDFFQQIVNRPLYYLDAATVRQLGRTRLAKIEKALIESLDDSLKIESGSPPNPLRFQKPVTELMNDGPAAFEKGVIELVRQHLLAAGVPASLRTILPTAMRMENFVSDGGIVVGFRGDVFDYSTIDAMGVAEERKYDLNPLTSIFGPQYHSEKPLSQSVLPKIIDSISKGLPVAVGLNRIFDPKADRFFKSPHAITLTGLVVDKTSNKLMGFKYANSYGESFGVNGFGYISRDTFEQYFANAYFISSIQIGAGKDLP